MFAYPDRGQLKAQIIARVAAGETVNAICAESGMPCAGSVQVWRRADAWFAGELAAAQRKGAWRRELMFDEAVAQAFVARVAAGGADQGPAGAAGDSEPAGLSVLDADAA